MDPLILSMLPSPSRGGGVEHFPIHPIKITVIIIPHLHGGNGRQHTAVDQLMRERELTEAEKAEQAALRAEYMAEVRAQLRKK